MIAVKSVMEAELGMNCAFHWPQFEYFRQPALEKEINDALSYLGSDHHTRQLYESLDPNDVKGSVAKILEANDPWCGGRREWFLTRHGEYCTLKRCCA